MSLNLNSLLADLEKDSGITKQASVTETTKPAVSAELASVLEKKASEDLTARAFSEGEALAKALLEKMAENNIIADNNAMVADDNTKVIPNPQGTVEQVLEGVVDNAKATGATSDDRVDGAGPHANNVDPAGALEAHGEEKTAADASAQTKEEKTMDKIASDSALAKFIMEKIAQEFSAEVTTDAAGVNTQAAPAPNKIQRDNAVMTAQDDLKVKGVVPGGDGTVNALFQTIVETAKAQGGQSDNLVESNTGSVTPRGESPMMAGGPGPASEGQEKAAAVSMLVAEGMDFDLAVDLVKQAEEEILSDSWEQEKQACLGMLMEEGIDFDTAVTLVKQAEEEMDKQAKEGVDLRAARAQKVTDGRKIQAGSASLKDGLRSAATKASVGAENVAFGAKNLDGKIFKKGVGQLAGNKLVRYGAGAAALATGAAALARSHEKKACIDALIAEGIDFDTAVELTKQASVEVYGE